MRATALVLALALGAACGGAASPFVSGSPEPAPTATVSGSGVAATGIVVTGTVVPVTIAPGVTFTPAPTIPPTPTPSPAPGGLTQAQLKYGLVDRFGRLLFCDPDFYPVARADEQSQADARFAEIQSDAPTFTAIVAHLGIPASGTYSSSQRLAIYRDWKMLNALRLEPVGQGFHFLAIFSGNPAGSGNQGTRVDGTIDQRGTISVASQTPSGPPPCPICLARGTRIATPTGDAAVEDLRVGDLVWTEGPSGTRVAAPLISTGSTPVPPTHLVVHLVLSDGRTVDVSPGHPTADGRRVGDLAAGDLFDGAVVSAAERVPYSGGATYDVLPASSTGTYWANGVLLGSTIRP